MPAKRRTATKDSTDSTAKPRIYYFPVPGSVLFKTGILLAVLIVAAVAMVNHVTDAVVWTFLTMIAGYAALSQQSAPSSEKND